LSEGLQIPIENLLSPEIVRQLCFEPINPLSLETIEGRLEEFEPRNWQIKIAGPAILSGLLEAEEPDSPEKDEEPQSDSAP
jgi:ribonuclease D